MASVDEILKVQPTLVPVEAGGWLAVAGPDAPLRAGALEATEVEAREAFAAALARAAKAYVDAGLIPVP